MTKPAAPRYLPIVERIGVESRAGAPDDIVTLYAIIEGMHALVGHEGDAQECDRCGDAVSRALQGLKAPGS